MGTCLAENEWITRYVTAWGELADDTESSVREWARELYASDGRIRPEVVARAQYEALFGTADLSWREEEAIFSEAHAGAISDFAYVEFELGLLCAGLSDDAILSEALFNSFMSISAFSSKAEWAHHFVQSRLQGEAEKLDAWRKVHLLSLDASTSRNKLAHWGCHRYMREAPGRRVALCPFVLRADKHYQRNEPVDGMAPPEALPLLKILKIRQQFFRVIVSTKRLRSALDGQTSLFDAHDGFIEEPTLERTIRDFRRLGRSME